MTTYVLTRHALSRRAVKFTPKLVFPRRGLAPVSNPGEISGTLTARLSGLVRKVRLWRADTGALLGEAAITGSTWTCPTNGYHGAVYYTLLVWPGTVWVPDTARTPGELVFPTTPDSVPFFFECQTGGVTGSVEPAWDTQPGQLTTDNEVVWQSVHALIQPESFGPLILP